jgi:diaminopimelate epimerase
MRIPFTKAHGAKNDFLLTWSGQVPKGDQRAMARAICDRHTGIGADGWMLVTPSDASPSGTHGGICLYNSDGSDSEISGNGTRCAAAFLLDAGAEGEDVRIATGAGTKHLRLLRREGSYFEFEMNMGRPVVQDGHLNFTLLLDGVKYDATILNIGNPQCAVFVESFNFDWRDVGRRIEWHQQFPKRTNVSFIKTVDKHSIDVLFWERGAGETLSSGTGSSGAAAAAILRGVTASPVAVRTPAGTLPVRWDSADVFLSGPAEIVASGEFYWKDN